MWEFFLDTHSVAESFGLLGFANVFQADILTIRAEGVILTNSQVAINILYSVTGALWAPDPPYKKIQTQDLLDQTLIELRRFA